MTGKPRKSRRRGRSEAGEQQQLDSVLGEATPEVAAEAPKAEEAAAEDTSETQGAAEGTEAGAASQETTTEAAEDIEATPETIDLSAMNPEAIADTANEPLEEAIPGDLEAALGPETVDLSDDAFTGEEPEEDPAVTNLEDLLEEEEPVEEIPEVERDHLKGVLEALVFASDRPLTANELARLANAQPKEVKTALTALKRDYLPRGIKLDEVAGGFVFRTDPLYAPYVRDMTKAKPVKLSRAQIETLAILAYRQPITRPEIDEIRGVDCGAVLKMLLERDLIRILGKKDEPGRPLLYGTTGAFLEFFGLKSLKDLPTLHEFTELNEESRRVVERELGEVYEASPPTVPAGSSPPNGEAPELEQEAPHDAEQEAPGAHEPEETGDAEQEAQKESHEPHEPEETGDAEQEAHEPAARDAEEGDHSSSAGSE